ncbi:hypothetical protein BB558_003303 [Smittium angustum]|uniref:Isoleucine--tRNA ligase, mitochondrial n=1 Tax=Smittium angustum TaxID=133377 RepID=A0A2U1J6Q2_SMIAN|nr:hypothetical protein BB558_003303 [Smittium angustum]
MNRILLGNRNSLSRLDAISLGNSKISQNYYHTKSINSISFNAFRSTQAPIHKTRYYQFQNLFKKSYAKVPDSEKNDTNNPYSHTLKLPKTDFPLRANAAQREKQFRSNISDKLYEWQLKNNTGDLFVLHDGPPYANGDLHIGHFLNKTLKDIINRYQILKGKRVKYVPGWDCHGLPIEVKALEKIKTNKEKRDPKTVRKYAEKLARSTVEKQKRDFKEWAIIGDWDNAYKTLDVDFEIRELNVFREIMKKGLIFRKNSPVYWSPSSKTALAESELEYDDSFISKSVYVKYEAEKQMNEKFGIPSSEKLYFLIWTTTPWTLPANRGISVNPEMEYIVLGVKNNNETIEHYVVAKELHHKIKEIAGENCFITSNQTLKGKNLDQASYKGIFSDESYSVLLADYVSAATGTGLVHTAPGHGKDDYELCSSLGMDPYSPVDENGNFTDSAGEFLSGKFVLGEGNETVINHLRETGFLFHFHDYKHSYPLDWRTKKPIIQRSTPQWFIDISNIKNDVLESLKKVNTVPESSRRRLVSFVKSRTQWCISRQRPWGTPIPALFEEGTDEPLMTLESVDYIIEKMKEFNGSSAWWNLEAEELLAPKYRNNGKKYYKRYDTMDVWFDSGTSWTLFPEKIGIKNNDGKFVADVYLEGSDQHRGWFQSSLITSNAIQGVAPYKTLYTHGFLLDENGIKMSKSIGNTVQPSEVINGSNANGNKKPGYGVDVLRLWVGMHDSSSDMQIGPQIISNVSQTMRKIRGTFRFLLSNLNDFGEDKLVPYDNLLPIDKFALDELYKTINSIEKSFDEFMFYQGTHSMIIFINTFLSSLYFDTIKDRLYADHPTSNSRLSAQTTCHHILRNLVTAISPITPHFSQEVFEFYKPHFKEFSEEFSIFTSKFNNTMKEWDNFAISEEWTFLKNIRNVTNQAIEQLRQQKIIGSSLDTVLEIYVEKESSTEKALMNNEKYLDNFFIVSGVKLLDKNSLNSTPVYGIAYSEFQNNKDQCVVIAKKSSMHKCPRCWKLASQSNNQLCHRCETVVAV